MSKPVKTAAVETVVPIKGFTGHAVTLVYQHPNLTQVMMLEIDDGIVVASETLSDPDAPSITMSKAESLLWRVLGEIRKGF